MTCPASARLPQEAADAGRRKTEVVRVVTGVGIDVVDCEQFGRLLAEPGSAFAERTFTPAERRTALLRPSGRPELHLAARYAAKEACLKALCQSVAPAPLPKPLADLSEIEVLSDEEQRPAISLSGRVRRFADEAGVARLHVSLSHDGAVATAVVIAERS